MKKIVELLATIDGEETEYVGIDVVSLVEQPAIGIDFFAFGEEQFVEPKSGESEGEFISRCIPVLINEGYPNEQAAAICYSYWRGGMAQTEEVQTCAQCGFLTENPCQPGWIAYGLKTKDGREVPNCIPIENAEKFEAIFIDGKVAFDNILAAIMFSYELGCDGYHEHEMDGKIWYMPCETHAENFESFDDYPNVVKENAAKGIRLNEEIGNKCATQVGKIRAQQLAQGKPISLETVKRMYSYLSRAAEYYKPEDETACGTISYLLWGGVEALKWAESKLELIEQEMMLELCSQDGFGEVITEDTIYIDSQTQKFTSITDFLKGVISLDILGRRVQSDKGVQKFKYSGPPAERNFCKAMIRLNKMYTREEIDQLDRINTGFRHKGQQYSIFQFKGGVYCKHYWEELSVFKGTDGRAVIISRGPAEGDAGSPAAPQNNWWKYPGTFKFQDEEQRIVVGPAMIPNQLILRKDEMGNPYHVFFSRETIKELALKFFKESKQNRTDINHDDEVTTDNVLLESWIVEKSDMDKAKHLGFNVPEGTWMMSYKINDEDTWNKIKEGKIKGFSVAGDFLTKNTKLAK